MIHAPVPSLERARRRVQRPFTAVVAETGEGQRVGRLHLDPADAKAPVHPFKPCVELRAFCHQGDIRLAGGVDRRGIRVAETGEG
jgi:hypothetical protein